MEIIFHAHACFEFRSRGETSVLIDPYRPDGLDGLFALPPIVARPDVIALTHYHEDHAWILDAWKDVPIADHSGTYAGIPIEGIPAYHDDQWGTQMGIVTMLRFLLDDLHIVHLGDLGKELTSTQVEKLGSPDILLLPVGDTYTLGPEEALLVARRLNAGWIVPMHGRHPDIDLPLRPIEDFLEIWDGRSTAIHGHRTSIESRPDEPTVLHLVPAGSG